MKNKRGISVVIGYVLLVVIAISLSLLVYAWLKGFLPGNIESCPDDVSLIIKDYNCANGELTINLKNQGLFNLYGFIARAGTASDDFFYNLKENGEIESYFADNLLKPNEEEIRVFDYSGYNEIDEIMIEPFVIGEKGDIVLCENAIIRQGLESCGGGGGGGNRATTINLNNIFNLADGFVFEPMNEDSRIHMKWDTTSIPAGKTINNANLCLYINSKTGTPDNDANISRFRNETWIESDLAALDPSIINQTTDKTWGSTSALSWSCIDITLQVQESYKEGEKNLSLILDDMDNVWQKIIDTFADDAQLRFGREFGRNMIFEDRENTGASGNTPYLNITYA